MGKRGVFIVLAALLIILGSACLIKYYNLPEMRQNSMVISQKMLHNTPSSGELTISSEEIAILSTAAWDGVASAKEPAYIIDKSWVITTDKTRYDCLNGFCEIRIKVQNTDRNITDNVALEMPMEYDILSIKYLGNSVSKNWLDNKTYLNVSEKAWIDISGLNNLEFKKDEFIDLKLSIKVSGSGEFNVTAGDGKLDPYLSYNNFTELGDDFDDASFNASIFNQAEFGTNWNQIEEGSYYKSTKAQTGDWGVYALKPKYDLWNNGANSGIRFTINYSMNFSAGMDQVFPLLMNSTCFESTAYNCYYTAVGQNGLGSYRFGEGHGGTNFKPSFNYSIEFYANDTLATSTVTVGWEGSASSGVNTSIIGDIMPNLIDSKYLFFVFAVSEDSAASGDYVTYDKWNVTTYVPNMPPSITSIEINETVVYNLTWLNATAQYYDPEASAGTVYFNLTLNGNYVAEYSESSVSSGAIISWLIDPGNWSKNDNISVIASAFDGEDISVNSTGITVNNTIPVVLALSPVNESYLNSLPVLNFNGTDYQDTSDILTFYAEIDNNSDFSSPEYVNASIANTNAVTNLTWPEMPDGAWYWRVLASDAQDNSSWSSARFFTLDKTPPNITLISQTPVQLNNFNVLSNPLIINYSVADVNGINASSVVFHYKSNNTVFDNAFFVNGVQYGGWLNSKNGIFNNITWLNVSDVWEARLDESMVYPGVYNYNPELMEDYVKSAYAINNNNDYLKVRLYNVSNKLRNNILEFYADNITDASGPLTVYYCNSSYISGQLNFNDNCFQFASVDASELYNHSHGANSRHYVKSFIINTTTGNAGSVYVTNTSYFLLQADGISGWNVYYINNISSIGAGQYSNNNGLSWANLSGTPDLHLHQNSGAFSYYVCANDTFSEYNSNCSDVITDNIDILDVPPTAVQVISPLNQTYKSSMNINYTQSFAFSNSNITFYNITLHIANGSYVQAIQSNNALNLSYVWDTSSAADGSYRIKVRACDTSNLCSNGYSRLFSIDNTYPLVYIDIPMNTSYVYENISLNYSIMETNLFNSWFVLNDAAAVMLSGNTSFIGAQGANNLTIYANDTIGSINYSSVYFFVDSLPPMIYLDHPVAQIYTASNISLNYSVVEALPDTAWYTLNGGADIILTGNTTLNLSDGDYTLIAYINDTSNNLGNDTVAFTVNAFAPVAAQISPLNNSESTTNRFSFNGTDVFTITFYIEIDNDSDFSSPEYVNSSIADTGGVTVYRAVDIPNGVWNWRVLSNDGTWNSSWSQASNVTVNIPPVINLTCDASAQPYIKAGVPFTDRDNIDWLCKLTNAVNQTVDCVSYCEFAGKIIQINPEKQYVDGIGEVSTFRAFNPNSSTQLVNVHFTGSDLRDQKTVTAKVFCLSTNQDGEIVNATFEKQITPQYKDPYLVIDKTSWFMDNIQYILGGIFILLFILVFAGVIFWFIKR